MSESDYVKCSCCGKPATRPCEFIIDKKTICIHSLCENCYHDPDDHKHKKRTK